MADRLEDKVAIVTGASSPGDEWGNGKATAVLYGREGAKVLCVDRSGGAQRTVEIITGEGGTAEAFRADVTSGEQVEAMVAHALERFGRIDILHNNVGADHVGGPVQTTETAWNQNLALNVTSQFLTCKHALPVMERQGSGAIVNISSIAGIRWVGASSVSYATSKAAVIQFTQTVALEYGARGIRANALVLGVLRTPALQRWVTSMADGDPQEVWSSLETTSTSGWIGDAWDGARAAVFLASDEARYINGTTLVVDGGLSATMAI